MQPNSNRPVYIVQPSNITHLNVRPTIITTGAQQLQTQQQQQPVYQLSTIRQPVISSPQQQPASSFYQVQGQPRLVSASSAHTSLPTTQRFATSPQTLVRGNASISPRLLTPQTTRMPTNTVQTTGLLRPNTTTVSSPTVSTSAPAAPGTKEFSVRVPKTRAQYAVMEFASGLSIDAKDWKNIEMRREITSYNYRPATNAEGNASSNTITTSLGVVLPKTGAGSEYGREQKEALKRKRYATKGTNVEDLPWILTDRSSEKKTKQYRGLKRGSISANCSYYVFIQGKDGFEAYPVNDWYSFTPTNVYKTLDFEEAEKQYQERHKNLSKWFLTHQVTKEKGDDDEIGGSGGGGGSAGKKSTAAKGKRDFKLLDADDWINEKEEEEDDDDDDNQDDDAGGNKKTKGKKNAKKVKDGWTLSDEEDEDAHEAKAKKQKKTQRQTSEEHVGEDSDDGDHEGDEIEYTSDETSTDEDDIKDVDTVKSAMKYEVKGVDEEMKNIPDIEKKLEEMDENGDELDFDDDDEEFADIDDNEDEAKTAADDLSDVSKLLKNDPLSKEIETSSDSDDMDDSDDPDKEPIEPIKNSMNLQPIPSEQIKTEKGHKKAREEEMRAIKSKVMSLPVTPSNPTDTITEEKVRALLLRKQYMTFSEIIQTFLPKQEHLRTKEVKEGIVKKLATVIKGLNIEEKSINGKKHIKLK